MTDAPKSENAEKSCQGWDPPLDSDAHLRAAIEAAFDYRGDVTVETTEGQTLEGYVFDRRDDATPPVFRIVLQDSSAERIELRYDQVARLHFTGRDTAVGKSWETWVKKYIDQKQLQVQS